MANPPTQAARQLLGQLGELWGRQSRGRKTLAVLVVAGVLGTVAWTSLAHHVDGWAVAVDGISPDDAQELYAALVARGVGARLHDGKVEVPPGQLDEARAIAASAGLPFAGKGFELFDGNNLGQSSFAEQVNYRRALQGELARSITALAQVEGARVHLALGKHSVFREQEVAPSASVALRLHLGQTLAADQVRGIRKLVAASVEGLKPEAVVLVDGHGNLLDAGESASGVDRKAEIERTVAGRVRMILERVVGGGRVSVVATADVDDRKISETEDLYDKDHSVVRSEARTVEGTDATAAIGGVAGVRGNLPGAPGATTTPGSPQPGRVQETRNYEISHTVRQTTNPELTIQRLHLAVLVDYEKGPDGKPVARSADTLAQLTALARQAAGIDDARGDKIEVRSIPFAPDDDSAISANNPPASALPPWPVLVGVGAGALVLLIVVFVVVMRSRRRGRRAISSSGAIALPVPVAELERMLDARPHIERTVPEPPGLPAGRSVQDRVLDAVRSDVERAAGVLSAWLAEAPSKGAKP